MVLQALLHKLSEEIEQETIEFQVHQDLNTLLNQVRKLSIGFIEEYILSCLQDLLWSKEFLLLLQSLAGKLCYKFQSYRKTSIRLLSGKSIEIESPYFVKAVLKKKKGPKSKKRNAGSGRHLGIEFLGIIGKFSMVLASSVMQAALLCPSFEISKQLLKSHGIELDVKTIEGICMKIGKLAIQKRGQISLSPGDTSEGYIVLICIDGGRLRERVAKKGRIPLGNKRQGYFTDWKEPKQFVISILNKDGTQSKERLPIYDATLGDIDAAFDLLEIYLEKLDLSKAEKVVFCGDGARSYWKRADNLAKKLGVSNHFEVIDYTHAKQNLFEIIALLPKKISQISLNKIIQNWKNLLWSGNLDELYQQIKSKIVSQKNCIAALKKFKNYFFTNRSRMQYEAFKKLNIPTGSGSVESAIRRVINQRLKAPGTFWLREVAEVMLFLRSQLLSGRWLLLLRNILASFHYV